MHPPRLIAAVAGLATALLCAPAPAGAQPDSVGEPTAYARATPVPVSAVPADSVVDGYGVGIHLAFLDTPYRDAATVAAAIADLGVRHVRDDLYLDNPRQYAGIDTVAQAGARFDLIMGRPDSGATPSDYVGTVAGLPAGAVESLEGANEWDLFGPEDTWADEVTSWQQDLYAAAQAEPATADLPVLSPALAFKGDYAQLDDLSAVADVANVHTYPGGARPSSEIGQMAAAVRAVVPAGPLVTTEAGYHNATAATGGHRGVPEDVAADYLPRLVLEHLVRGEQRVYSYELIDEFADPDLTDPEAHFGLLRNDLTPKPAYTAMKNLLALLADPGPSVTPAPLSVAVDGFADIGDARYLLTQKRDGSYVLLLWRDVSLYDTGSGTETPATPKPTTVRVADPSRLSVVRPSESAEPVRQGRGRAIPVSLDGQVTAVRIDPLEPPGRSKVKASSRKPHRVVTRWSAPADHGHPITRYRVVYAGHVQEVGAGTRRLVLRGLPSGHRIRVQVSARNADGWGPAGRSRKVRVR